MEKQKDKKTSMFDQGIKTISSLLEKSATPAQVGGVGKEVAASGDVDKRNEKMAAVATVFKSFICKRGNQSKKNNRDSEEK